MGLLESMRYAVYGYSKPDTMGTYRLVLVSYDMVLLEEIVYQNPRYNRF
jgi:hypothetical protein